MPPDPRPEDRSASGASPASAAGPPPALMRAVARLLEPLVRLLLTHQVPFPALASLLKSVYVEQARRRFSIPGRPQTISRLSLLTGIHRKDVKRLLEEQETGEPTPRGVTLGAQLVLRWTAEREYLDERGRPRALPRLGRGDAGPSFERLVESVSKDIRPRAVLDEWIRLGVARLDDEDRVHLETEAFVPAHGFDEKAYYLGRNLHDHLAAAAHNLEGGSAPQLERSVYYARLRPASVGVLDALARDVGSQALQAVNRRARELQREDEGHPEAIERMSFGVWFHRAVLESARADAEAEATGPGMQGDEDETTGPGMQGDEDEATDRGPGRNDAR